MAGSSRSRATPTSMAARTGGKCVSGRDRGPAVTSACWPREPDLGLVPGGGSMPPGKGEKLLPDVTPRHVVAQHAVLSGEPPVRLHGGAEEVVDEGEVGGVVA